MRIPSYALAVCAVAFMASCASVDASPPVRQAGADNNQDGDRPQTASRQVDRIDLSERSAKLEDDLQEVRQKTRPVIIDLTWSNVGGDLLKNLHGMRNLQGLFLYGTGVSDSELRHLGELPNLEFIDLGACKVTAEGILRLRSSRKLTRLGLAGVRPPLDDNAVERIASAWPELESISLDSSQITDAGLSHVGNLRRLRYLNVSRTKITDKGLASLVGLPQLATLHAGNTNITDQGMAHLGTIKSLEKLDLNFTGVSDRGLREVRGLTNLKRIYFVGTKATDDGLEHLKPLKTIEFIGPSANISAGALDALKEALPLFKENKRG